MPEPSHAETLRQQAKLSLEVAAEIDADPERSGADHLRQIAAAEEAGASALETVAQLQQTIQRRIAELDHYDPDRDGYDFDMEAVAAQRELRRLLALLPSPPQEERT